MRMWNIDPKLLCRKHLIGEHNEIHKFVGAWNMGKNTKGYIDGGLIEIHNLRYRHQLLAKEMIKRGYNHKSPLPYFDEICLGNIDIKRNKNDLFLRCEHCNKNNT